MPVTANVIPRCVTAKMVPRPITGKVIPGPVTSKAVLRPGTARVTSSPVEFTWNHAPFIVKVFLRTFIFLSSLGMLQLWGFPGLPQQMSVILRNVVPNPVTAKGTPSSVTADIVHSYLSPHPAQGTIYQKQSQPFIRD